MDADFHRHVVEVALFGSPEVKDDTCLRMNEEAIKLLDFEAGAVSVIEDVLREIVMPTFQSALGNAANFGGLTEVLGAYVGLGMAANPLRTASFLRSMPPSLLREAISAIPIYFAASRCNERPVFEVTTALLAFLTEVTSSNDAATKAVAKRTVAKLEKKKGDERKRGRS